MTICHGQAIPGSAGRSGPQGRFHPTMRMSVLNYHQCFSAASNSSSEPDGLPTSQKIPAATNVI